jgi:hypothetical protein
MLDVLTQNIFIDGVQYFLDSSQTIKRVFYYDGSKWVLSSELVVQSTAPNTTTYKWWFDTSLTPPKLKYYDGSVWRVITMIY